MSEKVEDDVAKSSTISRLTFAWWNTSLAPPGKLDFDPPQEMLRIAEEVVGSIQEGAPVDLFGLGEVSAAQVRHLREVSAKGASLKAAIDEFEGERGHRRIGAIYNSATLALVDQRFLSTSYGGKEVAAGLKLIFKPYASTSILVAYIVHWPSRLQPDSGPRRRALGHRLQVEIESVIAAEPNAKIIVMGDFNDEPFDESLSHALLGSRDRRLVRRSRVRMYNPFWRILGERHELEHAVAENYAGGTHYYRSTPSTHWHTYDQFLVSATLLGGEDWTLRESEVRIWQQPPLLTDKGRVREPFDHFPVTGVLTRSGSLLTEDVND